MFALAMLVALLVDRLFGEPPVWMHPVVGMGRYLNAFGARLCTLPPAGAFIGGALAWCLGAALVGGAAWWLERMLPSVLLGLLLKPLMAWRMLTDEVMAVEQALQDGVHAGRRQLARLVSRDTSALGEAQIREAAIETLAENLNDSVVAPLFWFALLGLPGAAVYRFANTADAVWGYRGRWEWAGKWAARADDMLSWLPARITALAIDGPSRRLAAEAARTPSPNSGWPMAAMALRLDVALSKPGVYALNEGGVAPSAVDVAAARRQAARALLICAPLLAGLAWAIR